MSDFEPNIIIRIAKSEILPVVIGTIALIVMLGTCFYYEVKAILD